jgi:hypothetical protein
MKHQVIRHWNGTKGLGKKFNTREDAEEYLRTNEKVQMDKADGFYFSIVEVQV